MVLAALRSAYAPTKTVSVLYMYSSLPITMLSSVLQMSVWKDLMWVSVCAAPGPVGHLSFTEILDTSLKVSWKDPPEKNGILTGTPTTSQNGGFCLFFWSDCMLNRFLSCARRVSHFLGGIQQDKHASHALPAEHNAGVPGHWFDCTHYLYHSGGRYDLQRSRSAVVLHHFLWCATRSVSTHSKSCFLSHQDCVGSVMSSFSWKRTEFVAVSRYPVLL